MSKTNVKYRNFVLVISQDFVLLKLWLLFYEGNFEMNLCNAHCTGENIIADKWFKVLRNLN